jgi:ADP-heptose:LPS heptosyltransferase
LGKVAPIRLVEAIHKILFLLHVLFLRLRRWKRVIVLERTGGLGDVICCIPAYRALKQKYPEHLVIFATSKPLAALLRHCKEIDAVYGIPPDGDIPKEKAAWLVDRHYEPHTSDERGQAGQKLHLTHVFLNDCDLPAEDWQPHVSILPEDQEASARRFGFRPNETIIAIHTGRTWPVKELPEDRWQEIVDGLQKDLPCRIVHFCSPARYGEKVLSVHKLHGVQTMPFDLPLLATAAVLFQCRLLVGIDSGLLHLAGALGTPVIGVFGPTNPRYFLPLNPLAREVSHTLPCSFCHHEQPIKHWHTGCPFDIRCMKEIPANRVLDVIRTVLSSSAGASPPAGG